MSDSRRRALGLLALVVLIGSLSALGVWRIRTGAVAGWGAFSYVPPPTRKLKTSTKKPAKPPVAFGQFAPGKVMMLYPDGPGERAGLKRGDDIVAINGIAVTDKTGLTALNDKTRAGDVLTYTIKRDGVIRKFNVRFEAPTAAPVIVAVLAMNAIVALVFLSIGVFVFWRRPADGRAIVFYVMTLAAATSFTGSAFSQIDTQSLRGIGIEPSIRDLSRTLVPVATTIFFAPLLLHLALIFPVERPVMRRRRRTMFQWIYGFPLYTFATIAAFIGVVGAITVVENAKNRGAVKTIFFSAVGVVVLMTIAALVRVVVRIRRTGFREALISSPFECMTFLLAGVMLLFAASGWVMKQSQSPALIIGVSIICILMFFLLLATYPVATVISLFRSYRESGIEERRQVKWPLWGTMVAVGARILLMVIGVGITMTMAFGKDFAVSPVVMATPDLVSKTLYTLIPLSFAFAILKYRLMNIDVIIRRTILYSILTGVVFVLYAVLVAGLGTALVRFAGMRNQTMLIASTVVIALVTVPLRNRLQHLVDRNLFRERRDYPLSLRNIGNAIGTSTAVDAFLRKCAEEVQQALQNRFVVLMIRRDSEFVATAKVGVADEIIGKLRIPAQPVDFSGNAVSDALRKIGTTMVVPLAAHREPTGLLALGSRLSDEEFSPADVEFILAVASQIAVGIENVRLRDEEADFEQARAMQQILLPKSFPQLPGFRITGLWQPARSVGGDYFDTLTLGDTRAGICIADVAGKGMPAALLMANLQAAVKASASFDAAPAAVCERVKTIVCGNLAGGKFISLVYGVLDATSRTLTYCNAGHNPPVVVRANGDIDRLMRGGPAVCRLFRDAVHEQETISLQSGDRVVFFTDGVSEARRGEDEFGEDRLIELLVAERQASETELERKLLTTLREFTAGEFSDDVTFVIIAVA